MQLDVELVGRGLVDLLFEALQRLREEVRRRRGGREAQLDFLRGGGACERERCRNDYSGQAKGSHDDLRIVDRLLNQSGGLISTLSVPMPAISASMRSPGLRNVPFGTPTPAGVPVSTTSPGSSVISSEARAICSATE